MPFCDLDLNVLEEWVAEEYNQRIQGRVQRGQTQRKKPESDIETDLRMKECTKMGGSPGLVVMGDNSCSRGHGFKSRHCILDEHDIFQIDL